MILHLVLNSLIVFVILTLLIDVFLCIFNIKNARLRYLLRLFPILKFPLDFLVFISFKKNVFVNFNPFSCQSFMQDFITKFAHSHFRNDLPFTEHIIIPKYLLSYIPNNFLNIIVISILLVAMIVIARKIYLFCQSRTYLKNVLVSSSPCTRPISNINLCNKLKQRSVSIRISDKVHIPFAANLHYIFMPEDLITEFSQEEFESVIVHELEHLRWKDPILKMSCDLICALFWWLPSNWWLKKLELDQEGACDAEVYKYGIDEASLASAMVKVIKKAKYLNYRFAAISPFDSPKNSHARRIKNILATKNKNPFYWRYCFGIMVCVLAILCFWMC